MIDVTSDNFVNELQNRIKVLEDEVFQKSGEAIRMNQLIKSSIIEIDRHKRIINYLVSDVAKLSEKFIYLHDNDKRIIIEYDKVNKKLNCSLNHQNLFPLAEEELIHIRGERVDTSNVKKVLNPPSPFMDKIVNYIFNNRWMVTIGCSILFLIGIVRNEKTINLYKVLNPFNYDSPLIIRLPLTFIIIFAVPVFIDNVHHHYSFNKISPKIRNIFRRLRKSIFNFVRNLGVFVIFYTFAIEIYDKICKLSLDWYILNLPNPNSSYDVTMLICVACITFICCSYPMFISVKSFLNRIYQENEKWNEYTFTEFLSNFALFIIFTMATVIMVFSMVNGVFEDSLSQHFKTLSKSNLMQKMHIAILMFYIAYPLLNCMIVDAEKFVNHKYYEKYKDLHFL